MSELFANWQIFCLQQRQFVVTSRVAESSRIPSNTGSWSRIFLSDSGCPIGSLFTSHS